MKRLHEGSKPNLSFITLASFLGAFLVARTFTYFFPRWRLIVQGVHIHHFWYGLALLAIGGWLGINYRDDQTERIAAVIFGIGGGLVGDEIGLLATFHDYYSQITYTFIISVLAFAFLATLFRRHGQAILTELYGFFRRNADLYGALFLALLSFFFIIHSNNTDVIVISGIAILIALTVILKRMVRYVHATRRDASQKS
jgi:hypothetical protein